MNNKPVAWLWTKDGKTQSALLHEPNTVPSDPYWKDKGFKSIPLYTHPVKELTAEEISVIRKEVWDDNKFISEIFNAFARAILRKAQEK